MRRQNGKRARPLPRATLSLQDRLELLNGNSRLGKGRASEACEAKSEEREEGRAHLLQEEDLHLLLRDWLGEFDQESKRFQSPFICAQVKLTEALRLATSLPVPNEFVAALTLNMLGNLSHFFYDFRPIVQTCHAMLYDVIYDSETERPFFCRASETEKKIEHLKIKRKKFASAQRKLREEEEKHKELFDLTLLSLHKGSLKRTFLAWKEHVRKQRQHNKRLKLMFSKWWVSDDLKRWYFTQWQLFRESAANRRIQRNLERGNQDIEFHEGVVQDKQRLRDKKAANVASLEQEYHHKIKMVENQRKAILAAEVGLVDERKAAQNNKRLSQKICKLVEALGSNIHRMLASNLKDLASTPDVMAMGSTSSKHHNINGDDLLLSWCKAVLQREYSSDSSNNKKLLLQGAKSVHQLIELGLGLDLVKCMPESLLELADKVPDDEIVLHELNIENYNLEHYQLISKLAKCHAVGFRGNLEAPLLHMAKNLSAYRDGRRRTHVIKKGSSTFLRQDTKKGLVRRESSTSFIVPSATLNDGASSPAVLSRQESFMIGSKSKVVESSHKGGEGGVKDGGEGARLVQVQESFIDEALPLVGVEELLDAFDPSGDHQSIYLRSFLLTFFMSNPVLEPVLKPGHPIFEDLHRIRSEFVSSLGSALEKGAGIDEQQQGETESNADQLGNQLQLDELQKLVDSSSMAWSQIVSKTHQITASNIPLVRSWEKTHVRSEMHMWHVLSNRILAGDKEEVATGSSPVVQTKFSVLLREIQGKKDTQPVTLLSKVDVTQAVRQSLNKRFMLDDLVAKEQYNRKSSIGSESSFNEGINVHSSLAFDDDGRNSDSDSDIGNSSDSESSAGSLGESLGGSLGDAPGGENDVCSKITSIFCNNLDLLSLAFKRYSLAGHTVDFLKETRFVEAEKLQAKKSKAKFAAMAPGHGESLQLFHLIDALVFAAQKRLDKPPADLEDVTNFANTTLVEVFQDLQKCPALLDRQLYAFKANQLQRLQQIFEKMRTKVSPVGQISFTNWKNAIEQRKTTVLDKVHVTRQNLYDIFFRCAGEEDSKDACLCFTEFIAVITKIAHLKYPDPFQNTEQKLASCVALFA